ncbi:MAG: 2-C-methyl-D-erythritol 2,4-cyclodiphosphate synthase [Rickettsiales bacterium]
MPRCAVIILASGNSSRFGSSVPKPYVPLFGKTILQHAIESLAPLGDRGDVVIVYNPAHQRFVRGHEILYPGVTFIEGGEKRADSCLCAYRYVTEQGYYDGGAYVHDAARPFPPLSMLNALQEAVNKDADAVAPALPLADALRCMQRGGAIDRSAMRRMQTPQYLSLRALQKIISDRGNGVIFSDSDDDISMAEKAGFTLTLTQGDERAHKLTEHSDWKKISEIYAAGHAPFPLPTYLVGHGYDVHRFAELGEDDQGIVLGGTTIPYDKKLKGHSDADVLLHAIADALFGALSMRDIGYHFSDKDAAHKGKNSAFFIKYAHDFVRASGYRVENVDVVIIAEQPILFDFIPAITHHVRALLGEALVSIKATTTEKLGFEGRGEGIACHATVHLTKASL